MSASDEARATVMDRIRSALGAASLDRARRAAVDAAARAPPAQHHPSARHAERRGTRGAVHRHAHQARRRCEARRRRAREAVGAIASYLGTCNLPPRLRLGADPVLAGLPWREAWDIERDFGPAEPGDRASLSRAAAAAAETGTLFLVSGADNPTTLNFLPEAHTILIAASDIVGSYEEAFDRLRTIHGEGYLPRTVNLISGPSRTADIEQTIVRGAHGPSRLHVLILG